MTDGHLAFAGNHNNVVPLSGNKELDKLPPPNTTRWVARRKSEVINAVRRGLLTIAEACNRYRISEEEYHSWERLFDKHGSRALRVTRLKDYRQMFLEAKNKEGDGRVIS